MFQHSQNSTPLASVEGEAETGSGGCALLPAIQRISLTSVHCGEGNWLPQVRYSSPARYPANSYFDLDNTRFLDLLSCYLELRPAPLARLRMDECYGYTGSEVKLLRRLVESVHWDGLGMMEGVYSANGDEVGALTINHTLMARQKGYEELNTSPDERWRDDAEFLWESVFLFSALYWIEADGYRRVRPSTRMSDRLYVSCADSEM
jgi:hypothetical protein